MNRAIALAIGTLLTTSAFADQAAWVTKLEAETVAEHIKVGSEIRHFCAPCNDKGFKKEVVKTVKVEPLQDNYHQVVVNGTGIDAAYVYVFEDEKFKNVALASKIAVHDVPETLPADLKEAPPSASK